MSGDPNTVKFASVVTPHLADAFALARWLAGNRTDAEDIVQEACLRAFRAIGSFSDGSPRAWVLTIVRNTAYTWLAKHRAPHIVSLDDPDATDFESLARRTSPDDSGSKTPEMELIAKADANQLEAAIASLPVAFRETFVLRDIQGLNYRQIAEVTATPIGTVMSRLARARRSLINKIGMNPP
jgi:RNA polymerase sigma-70 factor (ECF subfamily)